MDNQHRKISGYRELTQLEIDVINEIKAKGREIEALIAKCEAIDGGADPIDDKIAQAMRWREIARDGLQQGLMALTRSVAKPDFF